MTGDHTDSIHVVQPPPLAEFPAAALRLLLEGHEQARQLKCDDWEFAIEIAALGAAGATCNQIRWLLHEGFALHGVESTQGESPTRQFRPIGNLSLPEQTCFVLTTAGLDYALLRCNGLGEGRPAPGEEVKPNWIQDLHELWLGHLLVKKFKQPAAVQELILSVFQEEAWVFCIADPLPPIAGLEPKRRLNRTIAKLNGSQQNQVIHFDGGGDGMSIRWRRLQPGSAA